MEIVIALIIGLVISLIIMMVHKSALKSVKMQRAAQFYVKRDSIDINVRKEIYLYKRVEKREKPKNNN